MKGEDFTGTRFRVAAIGKFGKYARTFIQKRQGIFVVNPFEFSGGIALRLFFHRGDVVTESFCLGLNYADRFFTHKQNVIGRTDISLVFPDCLPCTLIKIYLVFVLNDPSCL